MPDPAPLQRSDGYNPHQFWEQPGAKERGAKAIFVLQMLTLELKVSERASLLYSVLRSCAGKDGRVFPMQTTLAEKFLGRSRGGRKACDRTIRFALSELKKASLIKTKVRMNEELRTSDEYLFLWHPLFEKYYLEKRKNRPSHPKIGEEFNPRLLSSVRFPAWAIPVLLLGEVSTGAAMMVGVICGKLGADRLSVSLKRCDVADALQIKSLRRISELRLELERAAVLRSAPGSKPSGKRAANVYRLLPHPCFGQKLTAAAGR